MGLLKKIEIKPKSHPRSKDAIARRPNKTPTIDHAIVKKTIEELYKERGILTVHFYATNRANFKISEDGKFAIELDYDNKIFILYQYSFSIDVLCDREDFNKEKDAEISYYNFRDTNANAAIANLSDDLMRVLARQMEEKIQKENEERWEQEQLEEKLKEEEEDIEKSHESAIAYENSLRGEDLKQYEEEKIEHEAKVAAEINEVEQENKEEEKEEEGDDKKQEAKTFTGFKLNLRIGK